MSTSPSTTITVHCPDLRTRAVDTVADLRFREASRPETRPGPGASDAAKDGLEYRKPSFAGADNTSPQTFSAIFRPLGDRTKPYVTRYLPCRPLHLCAMQNLEHQKRPKPLACEQHSVQCWRWGIPRPTKRPLGRSRPPPGQWEPGEPTPLARGLGDNEGSQPAWLPSIFLTPRGASNRALRDPRWIKSVPAAGV